MQPQYTPKQIRAINSKVREPEAVKAAWTHVDAHSTPEQIRWELGLRNSKGDSPQYILRRHHHNRLDGSCCRHSRCSIHLFWDSIEKQALSPQ